MRSYVFALYMLYTLLNNTLLFTQTSTTRVKRYFALDCYTALDKQIFQRTVIYILPLILT